MTPATDVDVILQDCFLAVGQAVGTRKSLDFEAIVWWRTRYRQAFLHAMINQGNSWRLDRHRVTAVGRYLGQRALHHVGDGPTIDARCAALASADVEAGCRMSAAGEMPPGPPVSERTCTDQPAQAF